jgi:hypothetical protein
MGEIDECERCKRSNKRKGGQGRESLVRGEEREGGEREDGERDDGGDR